MTQQTDLQQFDALQTNIAQYVAPIKTVKVTSQDISESAAATLRELKRLEKKVEDQRVDLVRPHNDHVSKINEYAKQVKAPILDAMEHIRKEQLSFEKVLAEERRILAQKEREEREKREAEAQAQIKAQREEAEAKAKALKEEAEMEAAFASPDNAEEIRKNAEQEAMAIEAQQRAEAERIEFEAKKAHWDASKEIKSHKVTGITRVWTFEVEDESLVPVEFKMINDKAIKAKMSATKDKATLKIPGVRFFQDERISAR